MSIEKIRSAVEQLFPGATGIEVAAIVKALAGLEQMEIARGDLAEALIAGTLQVRFEADEGWEPGTTTVVVDVQRNGIRIALVSVPERGASKGYVDPEDAP
jgi:hypothetical protein